MKAIRIYEYGGPERMVWEDTPNPMPTAHEIVVAVAAAGVNPADYKFRNGSLSQFVPRQMPFTPGMDIVGRIVAVGSAVAGFAVGDRVLAMMPLGGHGGYAEQVALSAQWVAPLPAALDPIAAATIPTPGLTALQWIEEDLRLEAGRRLLVTGAAGAVGRIACFAAREHGVQVTAAVRPAQVQDVIYADAILILGEDGAADGFDAIADTIGGAVAGALLSTLRPGGVLSTVATDPIVAERADVTVRFFGNHADALRLARLAVAAAAGRLALPPPTILPMSRAAEAHRRIERGGAGKIVLVPDGMAGTGKTRKEGTQDGQ